MSLSNVPAGWAAFRVLRQEPGRVRPRWHGNWKHGARSKRGREAAREVRFILRVADSPRLFLRVPDFLLNRWFPPRPMGWREYFIRREAAGRIGSEVPRGC